MKSEVSALPDLNSVTSIADLEQPLPANLGKALKQAKSYLEFYTWVSSIEGEFLGFGIEGVIYLFLFQITPARPDVDSWVWVFVGDVPPAYITCEVSRNPYEAVDSYIGAMEEWVEAARTGKSVAGLVPVNVPATPEYAEMLDRRLKFIDEKILPNLK